MSATNSLLSANLRSHGRRYISTGLAVAISTAFIVITLIVMAAMTSSLTSGVYSQYQGGTIVVSQDNDAPEGAIESAEKALKDTNGVTAIKHMAQWPVVAQTTRRAGPLRLAAGPNPRRAGSERRNGSDRRRPDHHPRVHGLVPLAEGWRHSESALWIHRGRLPHPHHCRHHALEHDQHGHSRQLRDQRRFLRDLWEHRVWAVHCRDQWSGCGQQRKPSGGHPGRVGGEGELRAQRHFGRERDQRARGDHEGPGSARLGASVTTGIMLIFPAIAALVASIVVSSTFRVVLTQRTRELALLRTLGATRRQVRSLVTREAFAIGAISSAIGVVVGWLIGALGCGGSGLGTSLSEVLVGVSVWQLALTWLGATLFTTLVGVFPARAASRVAPIAALAPVNEAGAGSRKKHTLRFILGVLVAASGSALVAYAWRLDSASQKFMLSFGGALVALLGAVVAVSVLLPALTRAFGVVFPGMLSAMARENTMRNPGRTSATGSAILIGVTLVVTIMVGAASVRTTLTNAVNDARPFDLIAVSTTGELTDDQQAAIASTDGVAATVAQYAAPAS